MSPKSALKFGRGILCSHCFDRFIMNPEFFFKCSFMDMCSCQLPQKCSDIFITDRTAISVLRKKTDRQWSNCAHHEFVRYFSFFYRKLWHKCAVNDSQNSLLYFFSQRPSVAVQVAKEYEDADFVCIALTLLRFSEHRAEVWLIDLY